MSEILLQTLVDKAEKHDQQINEMEEKINNASDGMAIFKELKEDLELIRKKVDQIQFPTQKMYELQKTLEQGIRIFDRPAKTETIHHHHISKGFYIASCLFLLLCLALVGWYSTFNNVDSYKSNDTKYRYLKVKGDMRVQQLLLQIDSIYKASPGLRDSVIQEEELSIEQFNLLKQIEANEEDRKLLEKKLKH